MLAELQGNPLAVNVAWELGRVLRQLGLHEEALSLFEYAWVVFRRRSEVAEASPLFVVEYVNAMLDAGRASAAVEQFLPIPEQFSDSIVLQSLLVEALRDIGDDRKAAEIVARMQQHYEAESDASEDEAEAAEYLENREICVLHIAEGRQAFFGG